MIETRECSGIIQNVEMYRKRYQAGFSSTSACSPSKRLWRSITPIDCESSTLEKSLDSQEFGGLEPCKGRITLYKQCSIDYV